MLFKNGRWADMEGGWNFGMMACPDSKIQSLDFYEITDYRLANKPNTNSDPDSGRETVG
jgi:hypothetical protein